MSFTLLFSRARISLLFAMLLPVAQVGAQSSAATKDPRVARGEAVLEELTLGKRQPVLDAMRRDFPFLADATAGYALGDVWGRKVLDARTRQLAAMAAFASLGQLKFFKIHAGYALDAGVKVEELKEIVYLITVPAGFPRAIEASQTLQELLTERVASKKTSEQVDTKK